MSATALLVAAGRGERFGDTRPKQYLDLGGVSVLRRSVEAFLSHPDIAGVRVAIDPAHREYYEEAVADLDLPPPVVGGSSRQESVRLGLEAMTADRPLNVLIHDAVRPLVSAALIGRVLDGLAVGAAVLPVINVVDTLKRVDGAAVAGDQSREGLVQAQTPQGFRFESILAAHRALAGAALTDDAALATAMGIRVATVVGERRNLKITTPEDLAEAAHTLGALRRWRTGHGVDVHRLVTGRPLILGGVRIPHTHGLDGHSDADVALHAITDALLGAVAAGDIGQHFPPAEPRWRDAHSAQFLAHARRLVTAAGGRVEHVDLTLLCERPKIAPWRETIRRRIAGMLAIGLDQVSLKATTTERLGFTGREEGIMAQAVVTVVLER